MLWAFAREGGLPFSSYIARVSLSKPRYITFDLCSHLPGRSTHLPSTVCDWSNDNHQPFASIDQHWIIRGIRRLHFPNRRQLLLVLHTLGLCDAKQAAHNTTFRLTLGTIQAWACRRANHSGGNRLLDPWRLLLHVANDGETKRREHELLRRSVRRRHYLQSPVLALLWSETLHRSELGDAKLAA